MATAGISMSNNSHSDSSISSNKQLIQNCLTKIDDKGQGVPIFFLNFSPIVIGRSNTNSIWIDSENVSRIHAELVRCENYWQIKDANSTNGVYINNNQITAMVYYKLVKGDVICLGPPNICKFKFVLDSHDVLNLPNVYYKVPCCILSNGCIKNVSTIEVDSKNHLDTLQTLTDPRNTLILQKSKLKAPKIGDVSMENDEDSNAELMESNFNLAELISKNEQLLNEKGKIGWSLEASNTLAKIQELEDKLRETTDVAKITQKLQEQCETLTKEKEAIAEQLLTQQLEIVSLMQQVVNLERDKGRLEQNNEEIRFTLLRKNERLMREKMESEIRAKQQIADALNNQIEQQKEFDLEKIRLNAERIEGEKNLLQQLEDMRKDLQKKCRDAENLSSELLAYSMSHDQAFSNTHRQITAVMDVELVCSICSELFINTVTLGCTHSFCLHCINAWKREKRGCPICRADIQIEVNCVTVDNFIENMVLNFPPDEKIHREKIKALRTESQ